MPESEESGSPRPSPHPSRRQTQSTSASLLLRIQSDDQLAWRRLVELYSPLVYSWCRRSGLPEEAAGDVLQEVFLAVAKSIKNFRRDRPDDSFRGWLRIIARNKVLDLYREQAKQQLGRGGSTALGKLMQLPDNATPLEPPTAEEEDAERSILYQRALKLLQGSFEEKTWKAFWRCAVDGCPSPDVAEELGMTAGAVRQAKYKVLKRLNTELGDLVQ